MFAFKKIKTISKSITLKIPNLSFNTNSSIFAFYKNLYYHNKIIEPRKIPSIAHITPKGSIIEIISNRNVSEQCYYSLLNSDIAYSCHIWKHSPGLISNKILARIFTSFSLHVMHIEHDLIF